MVGPVAAGRPVAAGLCPAVTLLALLAWCANLHAQTPLPRAQVGPLQAWVARSASGACQLQLRNAGATPIVGWTVTVRSEAARYVSMFRHDGWRDPFHLPSASLTVAPGETKHFTVDERGAIGELTVRLHFLVRADDVAHGTTEPSTHVGASETELRLLQERRRGPAAEALAVAEKLDAAIAAQGLSRVLATKLVSTTLETEGEWNWWRVAEAAKAAEARPAGDPKAAADLSAAIDVLREAHRRGIASVRLEPAEPMQPLAVGRCDP